MNLKVNNDFNVNLLAGYKVFRLCIIKIPPGTSSQTALIDIIQKLIKCNKEFFMMTEANLELLMSQ